MEEINQLIKVLKKQFHLYETLDELCRKEEKAIGEGDLKRLEEIVREEEKIFVQMKIWESLRTNLVKVLKERFSLSEEVSFSKFIKKLEEFSPSSELESLQKKIISKIEEINQRNKRNIFLLEYSIKLIDEYFHRLTGTKSTSTYNFRGKTQIQEQSRKLLNKIS